MRRFHIRAFALGTREPPKEFTLWKMGENATDYGVHRWTSTSARLVMDEYKRRGNPLLIDVEHQGPTTKAGEPAVTGGLASLEIRNGLPVLKFDWSDYAQDQIRSGQRRFLSPEYMVDEQGQIVGLRCVSLVASPGTHGIQILASAKQEPNMDFAIFLAALKAANTADDPKAAIAALVAQVEEAMGSGGEAAPEATAAAGEAPPSDDQEEKPADKPAFASAKPAPAPVAAPTPKLAPSTEGEARVLAAAEAATLRIENAHRDLLLQTNGDRLEPSVRLWCASQPLAIVEGLISATSNPKKVPVASKPTQGEGQGAPVQAAGLRGEELNDLNEAMGLVKTTAKAPHVIDGGALVIPAMTPTQLRELNAKKAGK